MLRRASPISAFVATQGGRLMLVESMPLGDRIKSGRANLKLKGSKNTRPSGLELKTLPRALAE
jgi:hypothetical protein